MVGDLLGSGGVLIGASVRGTTLAFSSHALPSNKSFNKVKIKILNKEIPSL